MTAISTVRRICRGTPWSLLLLWAIAAPSAIAQTSGDPIFPRVSPERPYCPEPALSRVRSHTVAAGETLADIAQQYDLIPATLMGMNPSLRDGRATAGDRLRVPPYNGITVRVRPGTTWQSLAERYDVRADTLFEANGCQSPENIAFIPGANWSPLRDGEGAVASPPAATTAVLPTYPLPRAVEAIVNYGWVLTPRSSQVVFHSGVDLPAALGTPVRAAEAGTVAFAGTREPYGNFVVINHQQGRQTRYAHLDRLDVRQGQTVAAGDRLGTVGTTGTPDAPDPHLHFEVRNNSEVGWVADNPSVYF